MEGSGLATGYAIDVEGEADSVGNMYVNPWTQQLELGHLSSGMVDGNFGGLDFGGALDGTPPTTLDNGATLTMFNRFQVWWGWR